MNYQATLSDQISVTMMSFGNPETPNYNPFPLFKSSPEDIFSIGFLEREWKGGKRKRKTHINWLPLAHAHAATELGNLQSR